jgi:hypothetical protein
MHRQPALLRGLFGAALACATVALTTTTAHAQAISETLRGGLAVDAVGMESTPTRIAEGNFHIRLPRAARVRRALMFTATLWNQRNDIPAGPAGSPRMVSLGAGSSAITRTLEGPSDSLVDQAGGFPARWGTWRTDVTAAVRSIVGPAAAGGGVINIPVRERGDALGATAPYNVYPLILGHTLVVEYELDDGPLRNVATLELNAIGDDVARTYRLPGLIANRCPASNPAGETFPASLSVAFEYDNPYPGEENGVVTANGMRLTTFAGGSDDWDDDLGTHAPPAFGSSLSWAGLITAGSFGGLESAPGVATGAPSGVDNDSLTAMLRTPPPRLDDELYDFRPYVTDNDPTVTLRYVADTDSYLTVLAIQTLARVSSSDADGDTYTDPIEGDCTVDTDNDGTPDYLDIDSDNDCLPDARETAAGRVSAFIPGAAGEVCPSTAPFCDRARGVCQCRTSADCGAATPVCDLATRVCVACASSAQCAARDPAAPVCATAGDLAGRCVQCGPAETAACDAARPLCDAARGACVGCLTAADCGAATPVCDASVRACRPCAVATQSADCPAMTSPVCAVVGPNAGRCVACSSETRGACAGEAPLCSTRPSSPNVCVGCNGDPDCSGATPVCDAMRSVCRACDATRPTDCAGASPACASDGRCVQCTAANTAACTGPSPRCDATSNRCVQCATSADCAGATPFCEPATRMCRACTAGDCAGDRPVCATSGASAGRCVQCTASMRAGCPMDTPLCDDATNQCVGCLTGADCGEGRRCNATDRRCEPDPAYVPDAGPPPRDVTPPVDVMPPAVDVPLTMDAAVPATVGYRGGGCGCRTHGGGSPRGAGALALVALLAARRRRRAGR